MRLIVPGDCFREQEYFNNMSEWREVQAEWLGDFAFRGTNPTGGQIQMGEYAGKPGISPMEMLLLGAAGCTGIDVVSILEKARQDLRGLRVQVRGKRAEEHPKVWKVIEVKYLVWGLDIDPKIVERAIQLSEEKYCSASNMLRAVAEISSTYQILIPGEEPTQTQDESGVSLTLR